MNVPQISPELVTSAVFVVFSEYQYIAYGGGTVDCLAVYTYKYDKHSALYILEFFEIEVSFEFKIS